MCSSVAVDGSLVVEYYKTSNFPCIAIGVVGQARVHNQIIMWLLASLAAAANPPKVVILGGTGRIGTAVASHLLASTKPGSEISVVLAGRSAERGRAAVEEVLNECNPASSVAFEPLDWRDSAALRSVIRGAAAVVHTAGPYADEQPDVLTASIAEKVPVYVDLSDPLEYLDAAKAIGRQSRESETLALCAAGAFPGLSNVLAMECVARLGGKRVRDIDFSYFTAGLGGSGEVNLYITNDGFGCPVPIFQDGKYEPSMDAGSKDRATGRSRVRFFLEESDPSARLVGERAVWSWPFPEGALVPRQLEGAISGSSSVGMGTAPDIWNGMMSLMVSVVPRPWWRSKAFSTGLAKFSKPLVEFTDLFVGETHAMRIDVTAEDGSRVSAVQAHESFRRCVGMSCACFVAALLESKGLLDESAVTSPMPRGLLPASGVFTPEELFAPESARQPVLDRLLATPGTLNAGFEEVLN
jgi:predicted dinucleotide-binding enzyme